MFVIGGTMFRFGLWVMKVSIEKYSDATGLG